MVALRKYTWVGFTAARSNSAYLSEVLTRILFMVVVLFIFLHLWRATYGQTQSDQLGGLTLAQMLWYVSMTEALTLSTPVITREVDQDVRTGALAVQLTRPLNYPLYRLFMALGERAVRFPINMLVGAAVAWLLVGPIPFTVGGLLLFAVSLPFAFVLNFLGLFLIGLGAFWMEDTSGLFLIYSRVTMILGGMLIPLELFPEGWQSILKILPFSSMVYGPAHLFVQPDPAFLADLLVRQGAAIIVFAVVIVVLYRAAIKRINANGG